MVKLKASLMVGEKLDNCSNLTLFFMNNGKVIGTTHFNKMGCNINVINYATKNQDFDLMISSGLYEIFGTLQNLKLGDFCEITIVDDTLIYKAVEFIKTKKVYCEEFQDDIDRKMGR